MKNVIGVIVISLLVGFGVAAFLGILTAAEVAKHTAESTQSNDWYLVCSGKDKDYLVKSDVKPYTKDGFIHVGGESFITPEAGMTCKPVMGELVREAISQKSAKN